MHSDLHKYGVDYGTESCVFDKNQNYSKYNVFQMKFRDGKA